MAGVSQLEHLTPIYENTTSDALLTLEPHQGGLCHEESHDVMQKLASSIDLHKLASVFYGLLKAKLNIDSVTIQFPAGALTIGDAQDSSNMKTLDQIAQHSVFATLTYSFSKVLSMREATVLNQLHKHFKYPLKNALEHHAIKQLALKDHLTSLGNRANYQETLFRFVSQAKRQEVSFGLLVIDMDKFKPVNDTYGHHEGDKVLMAMAEVLRESVRGTDYAFRFGGDEFCCLLPGSDSQTNSMVALRIQALMTSNSLLAKHRISCSIGSTNYQLGDTEQDLFNRADQALYLAKQSGRSCYKAA